MFSKKTNGELQNNNSSIAPSKTGSITRKTLIQITVGVASVIVASTAFSYFQVFNSIKLQTLGQLEKYVVERGEREKAIFLLAQDNHVILKQQLLTRLQSARNQDPKPQFEQLFVKSKDQVIRNRPDKFDGRQQAGVYIGKSVNINADIRRRVLTFYNLVNSYGSAWVNRFQNTYITTPENIMVLYWPKFPTWAQEATADLYMPNEEYVSVASQQQNPARKTVWTGVYYDKVAKDWMVSCETPVDLNGRHIATIGHDVLLDQVLERTVNQNIEGGYNIIFRGDGRLIAHPKLMNEIQKKEGVFNISESGDAHLKNILKLVNENSSNQVIIENKQNSDYLAVTKLTGPDWYFVTVLPKSILTKKALEIARSTLFSGLAVLLIVIAIVFLVLRRQIADPLGKLMDATNKITQGDYNISVEDHRQDELGSLARSLNLMAKELEARTNELENALAQQASSVNQTTSTMDELSASSQASASQSEAAAAGTREVLSLVDGNQQIDSPQVYQDSSLREKVGQIGEEIKHLSEQTQQIGMISTLVSELANQTNMLALNAAVEAVRAGEHGKGFGVVASEIRKLADQSKKSAQRINALVQDIQKATNSTVKVTEEGKNIVESVVAAVNNIATNSQQISLNAKQQAIAIQQVVAAMNDLNQGARQIANDMRTFGTHS
ncbi:methyl-accepting chemotaxis sensory transducer with Cache sensor [Crinalium epipsammum PCC 9333]|uniref:Methyl-accepting chemotaxis sensory transducer with Cache sensor n=1 Tax=Crinalium epipsammum PCC 9333 TaxID=1173022 RepID=K9W2D3_9CYAN|nr:methyl-accepting chemotaxis protein [Crinalium epipsammum]AFZ13550.1 methyl-accepting chemotaxis sensory transducer with Cache sensor [Crinalium epipsammum PCC 9333]